MHITYECWYAGSVVDIYCPLYLVDQVFPAWVLFELIGLESGSLNSSRTTHRTYHRYRAATSRRYGKHVVATTALQSRATGARQGP